MSVAYDDRDILNTFVGLKAEQEVLFDQNNTSFQVNVEDFDIILYHIKNLCGGNIMYYEYLLDWLAYPIQTGEKTNVAVISYGGQGCGKSIIFEELMGEHIYGKQLYASISGGEQIGGSFNSHITGNMFLNIAEPNDFSKAKLNKLKDLITSSTAEVNSKGKDQVFVDDFTNYVFTCNTIPEDMLEVSTTLSTISNRSSLTISFHIHRRMTDATSSSNTTARRWATHSSTPTLPFV